MFNNQILEWEGNLYVIKRVLKEIDIHEKNVIPFKEHIAAETVLKKNGFYFFVDKIQDISDELVEPNNS
jgi:hypothetical protein